MSAPKINVEHSWLERNVISKPGTENVKKCVNICDLLCLPICETNLVGILRMSNITHILQEQLLTCPYRL